MPFIQMVMQDVFTILIWELVTKPLWKVLFK